MSTRPFEPDWAVPPGDMLREAIIERGWDARTACTRMGWRLSFLVRVLDNDVGIDPKLADDLAHAFGNSPEYWLALQRLYDEWLVKQP